MAPSLDTARISVRTSLRIILHRAALIALGEYGGQTDQARAKTVADFTTNRNDKNSGTLQFTKADVDAFVQLQTDYSDFLGNPTTKFGLRPHAISDPEQIRQLTAFFSWSAWASATRRPGLAYSYTNNWPPEPLVDNHATADAIVWSVLSLIALLGGIGLLLAAFGRWNFLGWHGREQMSTSFRPPDRVSLTPAQRPCAWFFFVMALLFLLQTFLGGASQHYRAEISNFFGLDLARILPFKVARTWHLQLAIFWVSTSYLAAGIFLVPMITGREPRGQHVLAYMLLGALALVVFGSLAGEFAGIEGLIRKGWEWFGNQGFEYLDLGKFWQILLTIGLGFWVTILFRGVRGKLQSDHMEPALAVLLLSPVDTGVLWCRATGSSFRALYHHRCQGLIFFLRTSEYSAWSFEKLFINGYSVVAGQYCRSKARKHRETLLQHPKLNPREMSSSRCILKPGTI